MADLVWSVLCHKAAVDKDSNQISLLDVVESLRVEGREPPPPGKVAIPFQVQLAVFWTRSNLDVPETAQARLTLLAPSGEEVSKVEFEVGLEETQNARTIVKIMGLPAQGPGRYWFQIGVVNEAGAYLIKSRVPLDLSITVRAEEATSPVGE